MFGSFRCVLFGGWFEFFGVEFVGVALVLGEVEVDCSFVGGVVNVGEEGCYLHWEAGGFGL